MPPLRRPKSEPSAPQCSSGRDRLISVNKMVNHGCRSSPLIESCALTSLD